MRPQSRFRLVLHVSLLTLLFVASTACVSAREGGSSGDRNAITQEQIQQMGSVSSAYNLVQQLRPNWLRKRGSSSIESQSNVVVYVEGSRRGGPTSLRQIQVVNVESMSYLTAEQATMRFGSGHDHGAIQVNLKSRPN